MPELPDFGRQKTPVQALRMNSSTHDIIQVEAKRQGITLSSLINRILDDYAENDRHSQRLGILRISPTVMSGFLGELSDESIEKVSRSVGRVHPRESLSSIGLDFSFENVRKLVDLLAKHSHWFEPEIRGDRNAILMHLRHRLNRKWSLFIGGYVNTMYENLGYHGTEKTVTEYSVTLRLVRPSPVGAQTLSR